MPLPTHKLIPNGLAEMFAPTVLATMTATVDIRHPNKEQVRNPVAGRTAFADQAPFYTGAARVQAQGGGAYLVAVPHTVTEAREHDVVRVTAGGDDPGMAPLVLLVVDVPTATIILQRNLRCEVYKPPRPGGT